MQKLIHHSPLGPLVIAGVLGEVEPGEPFEVDDDIAEGLLAQSELYAPAPEGELNIAQLRELAHERGVDITGLRKKADIAAAIDAATAAAAESPATDPDQDPDSEPDDATKENDE